MIYDAAHAFGVKYKGIGIGNYGDASVFSFHATKVFNTIEGGAVTFSDHKIYEKLYNLKNFGIRGEELVTEVGANAKMNEFCAIMGLCNLKYISTVMDKRKLCYEYYNENLKNIKGIDTLKTDNKNIDDNYAYLPVCVKEDYYMNRDELYKSLRSHNIYSRKYFYPLTSDQECFGDRYRDAALENARELSKQILVLPLYEELALKDVDRIFDIALGENK